MDRKYNDAPKYGSRLGQATRAVDKTVKLMTSPSQLVKLAILAFGYFCAGSSVSLQSPFFPAEAESKGASATVYGFIFGVFQLTIFLTAPIMGRLVTYISPKYLLNCGAVTLGTSTVLFGVLDLIDDTSTFVALAFTCRIVEGVGSAVVKVSSFTIVASEFPDNPGKAFAVLQTFMGVGTITGPTLGGAFYDVGGYRLPFFVVGSLVLIDAAIILFLLPKVDTPKHQEKSSILKFLLHPTTIIYSLSAFSGHSYMIFIRATLEPHLRQFQLSGVLLGVTFSLFGLLYAITLPGFGWLVDKKFCDIECLCVGGVILTVLSVTLIGPAPFLPLKLNMYFIVIALVLAGIGLGAKLISTFTGMLQSATNQGFPADLNTYGLVSSTIQSSMSLGGFAGPSLGGYLLDKYGFPNATMFQLLLEIVLMTLLIISVSKRKLCGKTAKISVSENNNIYTKTEPIVYEK
ncbi:hypothetical protein JTE90_021918 [Oedothorax gibbosus]|uniref:Major facilitator superfamily (MFS) profile domain-containing protein n=1 Tax=Oedothorax gibbosus TaxID=931172 RepID=A0AAV6VWV1_9ARAC|nr:hypothetical protein JTE90_021918 [Oedothorax gibbosus]